MRLIKTCLVRSYTHKKDGSVLAQLFWGCYTHGLYKGPRLVVGVVVKGLVPWAMVGFHETPYDPYEGPRVVVPYKFSRLPHEFLHDQYNFVRPVWGLVKGTWGLKVNSFWGNFC